MVCLPMFIESAMSVTYCIGVTDDVICFFHYSIRVLFMAKYL